MPSSALATATASVPFARSMASREHLDHHFTYRAIGIFKILKKKCRSKRNGRRPYIAALSDLDKKSGRWRRAVDCQLTAAGAVANGQRGITLKAWSRCGSARPRCSCIAAASAIIAPLSVHRANSG